MQQSIQHEQWSSKLGFLFAAVGSAVGLANIWRFPYAAGENGGGAFVVIYILAVVVIVLPILMAELLVGRRGQMSPPNAIAAVAKEAGRSLNWRWMGLFGVVAAVLIFSFYTVVGGWTIAYVFKSGSGELAQADYAAMQATFDGLNASAGELFLWASAFLLITVFVSARGVKAGIEKAVKVLMPALFIMLIGLVVFAAIQGDFIRAAKFLFVPDFSKINSDVILEAIGQAFFSIGVGITNLMAYGAYLDRQTSIPRASMTIITADTLVALLAGMAIFPIVFAYGMDPSGGPGLVFMTLPFAFNQMPGGGVIGPMFFLLLFFAALTSAISMMECAVAWLREKTSWSRRKAAVACGGASWALGLLSIFSFNILSGVHPLGFIDKFAGKTFFDLFDFFITSLMMPLCSIFVAIFAGWVLPKAMTADELDEKEMPFAYKAWRFLIRFVAPVGLGLVFLSMVTA
ncbi:sodium-dependent transporter [Shewanella eurypsychrophilus]|uniref:Transporter n=1 Tax=Shewanella eurypsychrophilus TaxID=2593656 RepID=A0ABX6V3G6_9GAMM|nr:MULTISPECIES: sodium-dependent transporter [Shewanella]QFU21888.1 sodium-dependent transporter [Shewanella sp. YLB-09]QPG57177.1 sodium-dependent transporter [Shewanella eurypsychrophilus]